MYLFYNLAICRHIAFFSKTNLMIMTAKNKLIF
jgi:hypothetical protein